jgi:signal transduction histidine kinase
MSSFSPQTNPGGPERVRPSSHADVQENLQRLDRLANLGLFSASIAHEIKNGLVAVNTFFQIALEKNENPELAAVVRRELARIDGLVTQMLRLAAPKPAALAPVNVHELLDLTVRLLDPQLHDRMVVLRRNYHAAGAMVRGDESRLQQAFLNLLLNAVEAMSEGGELTVATETAGANLKICIRDTGMGIEPETLSHIFDTFFTTKKNGTGLGLAISRRVVQEHHGVIEVESKPGEGSTFYIILPLM